jgi:hypothetical protein
MNICPCNYHWPCQRRETSKLYIHHEVVEHPNCHLCGYLIDGSTKTLKAREARCAMAPYVVLSRVKWKGNQTICRLRWLFEREACVFAGAFPLALALLNETGIWVGTSGIGGTPLCLKDGVESFGYWWTLKKEVGHEHFHHDRKHKDTYIERRQSRG